MVAGALTVRWPAFQVPSVSVPAPSGTCGWEKQAFLPLPSLAGCWSSNSSLACFSHSISFCSCTIRYLWWVEASIFTTTIYGWLLELCQLQFTCHQTPVGGWGEGRGGGFPQSHAVSNLRPALASFCQCTIGHLRKGDHYTHLLL